MKQYLRQNRIITDGAFGTYYAQKYNTLELPELANTKYPERVKEIHQEYLQAGAALIRTNTFAMNPEALSGEWEKVRENIVEGIRLARTAVEETGKQAFIAGDIGPIGTGEAEEYCLPY